MYGKELITSVKSFMKQAPGEEMSSKRNCFSPPTLIMTSGCLKMNFWQLSQSCIASSHSPPSRTVKLEVFEKIANNHFGDTKPIIEEHIIDTNPGNNCLKLPQMSN